jgi:hypothetical protein
MTKDDVSALVEREIARYRYEPGTGLIGRPWAAERVARELEELRSALVPPRPATLNVEEYVGKPPRTSDAWVVAESADGTVVAYEPATREFWLVQRNAAGALTTYGVNGDLVGTFMAR